MSCGQYEPESELLTEGIYGCFPKSGYHFKGPHNKDYSILGSKLGSPYFGKLPYIEDNIGDYSRCYEGGY